MNPFKKLAGQTAIYGLPTIVGRLLNYFLVPLYTYQFVPAEFGVVTELYAYVAFLIIVLTYGMETTLFRFSSTEGNKDRIYSTTLISILSTSLIFIFFIFLFQETIAEKLQYAQHPEYVIWFGLIIVLDAISAIPFARLREQHKAKRFAFVKSLNIAINIVLNLFFIGFCKELFEAGKLPEWVGFLYDPEIGVGYIFISNLIASSLTIGLLAPEIFKVKYQFDFSLWKRMMIYSLPLLVAGLAGMVNETLDRILLKYLLPENIAMTELGIYGACYKVSIIMTIFIQAYRFAAEPFFFSHAKEKDSKLLYADLMKYFIIACSLIFLATMMNISIIQYFVGPEFRVGLKVVPILLLANLFLGIFFNLSIWYKLSGQTYYGAYLTILGAIISLVLNFSLIPRIGYMGSAWAHLVCYFIMALASFWLGNKHYPVHYNITRILGYLTLSLTLFFISDLIEISNQTIKLILNNILLIAFVAVAFLIEKRDLKRIL